MLKAASRGRARKVCVNCHVRKVKCDLEAQGDRPCHNCRRHGISCEPRTRQWTRLTTKQKPGTTENPHSHDHLALSPLSATDAPQLSTSPIPRGKNDDILTDSTPRADLTPRSEVYIGTTSLMTDLWSSSAQLDDSSFSDQIGQKLMEISGADKSPSDLMVEASREYYYKYVYHYFPVLDVGHLTTDESSSLLLKHALCLVGVVMRQPREPHPLTEADQIYVKIKSLLFATHEKNFFIVLKVLCLLTVWNIKGPNIISMDNTWYRLSVAANLMISLGLHRDFICAQKPQPGCARRMAWSIFNLDKTMATVFDRPCILKPQDFDVRPLVPGDFATPDRKNVIFMAYCKLGLIRHQTQALQAKSSQDLQQEGQKIVVSLKEWIQTLPEAIHLYSTDNTKAYQREIFELHIAYFAAIIHYCHQLDKVSQVSMGLFPSLVASSCIARLYEEMNYRDDVGHLLTVHNWYSMMASAPLLSSCEEGQEEADISRRELDILETTLGLLRRKWYGARVIHDTIKRLRRGTRVGVSVATPRHPVSPLPLNDAQELFPFPNSLAPRMKLLDDEWARPIFLSDEAELQLPDMDMSWIFDEFAGTYNTAFVNTRDFLDPESAMSLEL